MSTVIDHPAAQVPQLTLGINTKLTDEQKAVLEGQQPWGMLARAQARAQLEYTAYGQCHRVLTEGQQPPILKWPTGEGVVDIDLARLLLDHKDDQAAVMNGMLLPIGRYLLLSLQRSLQSMDQALTTLCVLHDAAEQLGEKPTLCGVVPSENNFPGWWDELQLAIELLEETAPAGAALHIQLRHILLPGGRDAPGQLGDDPLSLLTLLGNTEKVNLLTRLQDLELKHRGEQLAPCLILAQTAAAQTLKSLAASLTPTTR